MTFTELENCGRGTGWGARIKISGVDVAKRETPKCELKKVVSFLG